MPSAIPSTFVRLIRDRKALLWVCQRHDLMPEAEPHDYELGAAEARLRYRDSNQQDATVAGRYWEAVWLEGAKSPLLTCMLRTAEGQTSSARRAVVVLASEADATAQVSSQQFLPVCVLPGLLDPTAPPDAQYGAVRARVRERVAWNLAARIAGYPGRVLIVIGARRVTDLQRLYEVLEDVSIRDLRILLLWPEGGGDPNLPPSLAVNATLLVGSLEDLEVALDELGAPSAHDLPRWGVRVGRQVVQLSARDVEGVLKRFMLLTERDLIPPATFGMEDLQDFLSASGESWVAYGAGLPVGRSYRSGANLTLSEETRSALGALEREGNSFRAAVLQLPCEGGAGATTMLRATAYEMAAEGYPVLLLRDDQVGVDLEELVAFSTALLEASLSAGLDELPPMMIVFDVEHEAVAEIKKLPQTLAAHGRRALVVQAIPFEDDSEEEKRTGRWVRLRPLRAEAAPEEVRNCWEVFSGLARRWALPIEIPDTQAWEAYERATRWVTPAGESQGRSLFWVALRFFLTEGMDIASIDRAQDALGLWVERRAARIADSRMAQAVRYIAALSTFRMVSPMWTVLRPVTGGAFSSELVSVLDQIKDIVTWGAFSEELDDQTLRFAHQAIAEEYLRRGGVRSIRERIEMLMPMLSGLSNGRRGDVWVAEALASIVLTPRYEERRSVDWDWRLEAFERLPPVVREQSKTVLHHWARCLYLSAERVNAPDLTAAERRNRLETAIEKLRKAIDVPRRPGRDEHPSHLFNTLGTAYARYADFLGQEGDQRTGLTMWDEACRAFQRSIDLSPGANVEALLAFSRRLLSHAERGGGRVAGGGLGDVAYALSLLDEADEILSDYENPDPEWSEHVIQYRAEALTKLSSERGRAYILELQAGENREIGFYCEARLAFREGRTDAEVAGALAALQRAEDAGIQLGPRSLAFRISLARRDPATRHDFGYLRRLYQQLEKSHGYVPRPVDLFWHAVLCYQAGEVQEGAERFRRLRDQVRRSGNPAPRVRDVWRDSRDPSRPRVTQIRVSRVSTEWRAEGYVDELRQTVPLRPRHFSPLPKEREVVACVIRFEANGPLAVPPRFEEGRDGTSTRRIASRG